MSGARVGMEAGAEFEIVCSAAEIAEQWIAQRDSVAVVTIFHNRFI